MTQEDDQEWERMVLRTVFIFIVYVADADRYVA